MDQTPALLRTPVPVSTPAYHLSWLVPGQALGYHLSVDSICLYPAKGIATYDKRWCLELTWLLAQQPAAVLIPQVTQI